MIGNVEHLIDSHEWSGLQRVGLVESERRVPNQSPTIEQRYCWVSFDGNVKRLVQCVRSHWGIENPLHWVIDVTFSEDDCRIRNGYAPENLVLVRHVASNLLKPENSAKVGIKAKRLMARWDDGYLQKFWLHEYAFALVVKH